MFKNKYLIKSLIALAIFGTAGAALAQGAAGYPSKTIRYIVGYTPGGASDMLARAVGQKLAAAWGQQVIIDNRPGAGTNIGTELGARAPADGYTLFMPTVANAINPTLYPKLNYDMLKDFSYITNFAKVPGIVVVHPSLPVKNARELIAIARTQPDALRHGSTGIGSPHHLAGEIFKTMAGVKMIHVPYKGATPAIADIIAGHIEVYFGAMVSTLPHARSGRLRAVAVTSLKRVAAAKDVPTLDEQGLKGFETGSWFGMAVPTGTPRDIIMKLHAESTKALQAPDLRDRMVAEGAEFVGDTPEQYTAFIKSEIEKWGKAVRASGAKAQ
ncbi:MAG: tripartite tricarboxylate transporter substrate binding protein [Burkholderiales bacterium]|nr:tripartite tricarboxylate transporter substrate binding protein [Burkholderiales bacterium]